MKTMVAALSVELLKIRRSMIFRITILAALFISGVIALMMVLAMHPEILPPGILKTKVEIADIRADWPNYIAFMEMAGGAIGLILFGFTASWIFGREFDDRTLKDSLALPTSRTAIVLAKMVAVGLWSVLLSLIMVSAGLALGFVVGLPLWSVALLPDYLRAYGIATVLTILLCPPAAFAACVGRGTLSGVAFTLLCMGLANLAGNIGIGAYFPWTVPMLYVNAIGEAGGNLPPISYAVVILAAVAGTAATVFHWRYMDHCK